MSTNKTIGTAVQFETAELALFTGQCRVPARIKDAPEDFQVEEEQQGLLCTVGLTSDLIENFDFKPHRSELVAVTAVKRNMTTFDLQLAIAKMFGIPAENVTYGGLKDRSAKTAQRFVIKGVSLDVARRMCCPEPIRGSGFFLKDAAPATAELSAGRLVGNRFTLKVKVPGMSREQIQEYVQPRLAYLAKLDWMVPNAYGRQRLGRRQNLHSIGETL